MAELEPAPAPLPLLTASEMAEWDRGAVEGSGIPARLLMEDAGRAAAAAVDRLYPKGRVVAAVGAGNNGGDAVVLLRALRSWGREVAAVPVGGAEVPSELLHGWEVPVVRDLADACRSAVVVVDGILGTGARGAPREPQAAAIRTINASGRPVVSLDGPSGVDLTDGTVAGEAVQASVTVTFGALKRGLLLHRGRSLAGRILVVEIGLPPRDPGRESAGLVTAAWARARLPPIPPSAHKGTAGAVAVVAGRSGMGGAAILAAMGALRAGAGIARVVSTPENRVPVQASVPEALFFERDPGSLDAALEGADAVLAGPGMGTDADALRVLRRVLEQPLPVLLDADALTLLAGEPGLLRSGDPSRLLLTPHPGEMGRLLGGAETSRVTRDPIGIARGFAQEHGCTVLLKGAPSVVAGAEGPALANVTGHSGIATGGMGDTLGGIAAAFMAIGAAPRDAGALALFFSGRAAEIAGRGRSLLPRDLADSLGAAFAAPAGSPGSLALPGLIADIPPPR